MKYYLLLLLFILTKFPTVQAQDPVYSQFFATPLEINPAFTGLTNLPKFQLNYRNQWPEINAYQTYAVAADQYFQYINSGFGIRLKSDNSGGGIYNKITAGLTYSYSIRFKKNKFLKVGIDAGVINTVLDWNKLVFRDQLDPLLGTNIPGGLPSSIETQPEKLNKTSLDLGAGFLYYAEHFYVGVGVKHLNTPTENFLNEENSAVGKLPMRINAHGGYTFTLQKETRSNQGVFINTNLLVLRQGDLGQISGGAIMDLKQVFFGLHYRHAFSNSDAVIGYLGYEYQMFKIGYSYDYTISGLALNTGGSHEISLGINLDWESKNKINLNDCFNLFH